jgi:hypothetical protein
MYCSGLCRDSDWNSNHEGACFYTRHSYMVPSYQVLDLNDTQIPADGFMSDLFNCILQRLIQFIGVQKIRDAVKNNEPMHSWSANDPRTRGFRDGKLSTVDLEAFLSLEDNFDKIDAKKMDSYAGVINLIDLNLPFLTLIIFKAGYCIVGLARNRPFGASTRHCSLSEALIGDHVQLQVHFCLQNALRATWCTSHCTRQCDVPGQQFDQPRLRPQHVPGVVWQPHCVQGQTPRQKG